MLPYPVVSEIEDLLGEGRLSRRAIARQVGVSRWAVDAVATGVRRSGVADGDPDGGQPVYLRCPGCGMRVELPCVYCRTVAYVSRGRLSVAPRARRAA